MRRTRPRTVRLFSLNSKESFAHVDMHANRRKTPRSSLRASGRGGVGGYVRRRVSLPVTRSTNASISCSTP